MKTIAFLLLLGFVVAQPVENGFPTIISYENNFDGRGSYSFSYASSDGTERKEEGILRFPDDPEKSFLAVHGFYRYINPNGLPYVFHYSADENGFHPQPSPLKTKLKSDSTKPNIQFNDRKLIN